MVNFNAEFGESKLTFAAEVEESAAGFNAGFGATSTIHDGQNGATFFPSVSEEGVLSWANDRDLDNPDPVCIKGENGQDGYTPIKGIDYFDGVDGKDGVDGYTPVKGVDYFDGADGKDGVDGKDGYTPRKGVDYFDGIDGIDGKDGVDGAAGYTPVKGIDYFDGAPGKDGADGYSPVRGTDYWTAEDKAAMVQDVLAALPTYNGEAADA